MQHKINPFTEQFALKTGDVLLFHHGLNLVLYDYGSSPSLACWTGRQRKRGENLHFLSLQARERRIERRLKRIVT